MSEIPRSPSRIVQQSVEIVAQNQAFLDQSRETLSAGELPLLSERQLWGTAPASELSFAVTSIARANSAAIIRGQSDRAFVVAGPCSIHNPEQALQYAAGFQELQNEYGEDIEAVMRVYFEKPRTTVGWKGLINDPFLDGSENINVGLAASWLTLRDITAMGIPAAMERLDPITSRYHEPLTAYSAIGARNVYDQNMRTRSAGYPMPVGFKNSPEGSIKAAADGAIAAANTHTIATVNTHGRLVQQRVDGNTLAHIILRGDNDGTNYGEPQVAESVKRLREAGLSGTVIVDASHGNSRGNHDNQMVVAEEVSYRIGRGEEGLVGIMAESNIHAGKQSLDLRNPGNLKHGVSVTDACINLSQTRELFEMVSKGVRKRRTTL